MYIFQLHNFLTLQFLVDEQDKKVEKGRDVLLLETSFKCSIFSGSGGVVVVVVVVLFTTGALVQAGGADSTEAAATHDGSDALEQRRATSHDDEKLKNDDGRKTVDWSELTLLETNRARAVSRKWRAEN